MFIRYIRKIVQSIERIVQLLEANLPKTTPCGNCINCLQKQNIDISPPAEEIFRNMEYVLDRVGISDRTLLRYQQSGKIKVSKRVKTRKYYKDSDVERFRAYYHGVR